MSSHLNYQDTKTPSFTPPVPNDIDQLAPVHEAQILTYLNLTNKKLGYLINFNVPLIKDGIKRRAL